MLRRLRFLFTAPRFHTNQHYPASSLLDAGHEVTFVVLRQGQSETYDVVQPVVLGCSRVFDHLRRVASFLPGIGWSEVGGLPPVRRFWSEMRRCRPSVVVVRDPRSAYGLLSVLATRLMGAHLILYTQTPKGAEPWKSQRLLRELFSLFAGRNWITPTLGFPVADRAASDLVCYVPFVMPPQTPARDKQWFAGDCINLLAVGKFVARKNHRLFLDAVAALSRDYRIRATIVGECSTVGHRAELERIREHRQRLGLAEDVAIELNKPFPEVQALYPLHDVFVLASRDEPAAISHLEAMAHSLPVVCSDSNGTSCYIRPGENGFVFRTDDLDDLVACLAKLLADREKLVAMGRRSYQLVESEHAPSRYVEALVAMAGRSP